MTRRKRGLLTRIIEDALEPFGWLTTLFDFIANAWLIVLFLGLGLVLPGVLVFAGFGLLFGG